MIRWLKSLFARPEPGSDRWWGSVVPSWAALLQTPERVAAFLDGVHRYFAIRKIPARILRDGVVERLDGAENRFGLGNILQVCAEREVEDWNGLIAAHFDVFDRHRAAAEAVSAQLRSYEFARPKLRLRLWDDSDVNPTMPLVKRRDIPGLTTTLVLDLPEAVRTISPSERELWEVGDGEVFEAAMTNVWEEVRPEAVVLDPEHPEGLMVVQADSVYAASAALRLGELAEAFGNHGAFVSIPTRNGILVWPFRVIEDMNGMGVLVRATRFFHDRGPGSLSRRVWWVREGAWHEVEYRVEGDKLAVHAPDPLLEYLESITGEDPEPE